jgi:ribonuclease HI
MIFTDGSCWTGDQIGGWAYLAFDVDGNTIKEAAGVRETTISRMELSAAIEGLMGIWTACGPSEILVYSDSQYVVLGATNRNRKRKKNNDLWDELDDLVDTHEYVKFIHVKGHSDSEYNHQVDRMAGDARKRAQDSPQG